jgi:hypothetical protein
MGGVHKHTGIFNSIINTFELIDLHMNGGKYTWSNNQMNPTLERLDRFLVNKSWEKLFPLSLVYKMPRELSDHNPLVISLNINQPLRNLSFRFELSWLKHPDFLQKTQEIWDRRCHAETAFDKIQSKLKRFKQYFKWWGFNLQGENRKKKENLSQELMKLEQKEEEGTISLSQVERKVQLHVLLLAMHEEEEMYWFKRAHEKWLHEGDNNTAYFHRIANGRKRKTQYLSSQMKGRKSGGMRT